jgi:hypothetical protein
MKMVVINKLTLLTGREHREKEKLTLPKGWKARICHPILLLPLYESLLNSEDVI